MKQTSALNACFIVDSHVHTLQNQSADASQIMRPSLQDPQSPPAAFLPGLRFYQTLAVQLGSATSTQISTVSDNVPVPPEKHA